MFAFPQHLRRNLRTTNVIERCFVEVTPPHSSHGVLCERRKRGPNHLLHLPEIQPGMENPHPQPIYTSSLTSPNFGTVSPGLVQNTTDFLFRDLWLRPALSPRDRSLVTVSALIANGQTGQITYHLGRAMDNGLTQEQASETLTHIAFYAGWPCAFSVLPVVKEVFEKRKK